jgi:hypothetical protein
VVEESEKDGTTYRTFVPPLIVGPQAEDCAATLESGEPIAVSGKLTWKPGKTQGLSRGHAVG